MTIRSLADLLDTETEEWQHLALCAQIDNGDVFFPDRGESPVPAKDICALCEVRDECLDYALKHDLKFGVFGGFTGTERNVMKQAALYDRSDVGARDRQIMTLHRKGRTSQWIARQLGLDVDTVRSVIPTPASPVASQAA